MTNISDFWLDGLLRYIRTQETDLTHRQLAVLMMVVTREGPHTVRGLARALEVSKPVITRALDKLAGLGYLQRMPDSNDGRNVFIVATQKGADFIDRFETFFSAGCAARPGAMHEIAHG